MAAAAFDGAAVTLHGKARPAFWQNGLCQGGRAFGPKKTQRNKRFPRRPGIFQHKREKVEKNREVGYTIQVCKGFRAGWRLLSAAEILHQPLQLLLRVDRYALPQPFQICGGQQRRIYRPGLHRRLAPYGVAVLCKAAAVVFQYP